MDGYNWIGVDNPPEVFDGYGNSECVLVTDGTYQWMAYYCKDGTFKFAECGNATVPFSWTTITHWRHLPELPA